MLFLQGKIRLIRFLLGTTFDENCCFTVKNGSIWKHPSLNYTGKSRRLILVVFCYGKLVRTKLIRHMPMGCTAVSGCLKQSKLYARGNLCKAVRGCRNIAIFLMVGSCGVFYCLRKNVISRA